jgi:hypothetical protein
MSMRDPKAGRLGRLDGLLEWLAKWPVFVLLCVLYVLCFGGFRWRRATIGANVEPFDTRWRSYTPGEAHALLTSMGEGGRQIYAATQLTLDVLFPFVYAGLFAALLLKLDATPRRLLLVPAAAAAADLLENCLTAYLAWSFTPAQPRDAWVAGASHVVRATAVFTALKWGALVLSLAVTSAAVLRFFLRRRAASPGRSSGGP